MSIKRHVWVAATWLLIASPIEAQESNNVETICDDDKDNDGDNMPDCADADCFEHSACQPTGEPEDTENRCSDWVDNDDDEAIDCDDMDCQSSRISACKGSWDLDAPLQANSLSAEPDAQLKVAGNDESPEDLFGKAGDIDGERNYFMCTDGVDNDGDGRVDCADIGCQLDHDVGVCKGPSGFRFSVVGNVVPIQYDFELQRVNTYFSKLQLRVFGAIPYIQNSFFLISARVEKDPRISFALFQIPIFHSSYFNVNTGGATLSNILVISTAKQLLLDPAYKLYAPFEGDSGVALEVGGSITPDWKYTYRLFAAGGSGKFSTFIGGTKASDPNDNYAYSLGGQIGFNLIGFYSRWDSPFLYAEVPMTLALALGAKFEQRNAERFPGANLQLVFRYKRFIALFENYWKRELSFSSWQTMYNLQLGFLLWPKHFLVAIDAGTFWASAYDGVPSEDILKKMRDYWQARAALHWFFWRNIGIASIAYVHAETAQAIVPPRAIGAQEMIIPRETNNSIRIEVQYRF